MSSLSKPGSGLGGVGQNLSPRVSNEMWLSFKSKLDKLTTDFSKEFMFAIVPHQIN